MMVAQTISTLPTCSPFSQIALRLDEAGYHVLPVMPRGKTPAHFGARGWIPLAGWNGYSETPADETTLRRWIRCPDANVGIVLGSSTGEHQVIALDLDTDDPDELDALRAVLRPALETQIGTTGTGEPIMPTLLCKRGARGFTAFFRASMDTRTKSYRAPAPTPERPNAKRTVLEILTGNAPRQTVMPPSIHPEGMAYTFCTFDDAHETINYADGDMPLASELPILPAEVLAALHETLLAMGCDGGGGVEFRHDANEYPSPDNDNDGDDDPNIWRDLNNAALANLDAWAAYLPLAKLKRRGARWEAVPEWRPSQRDRPVAQRKPNLSIHPSGIRDMGDGSGYTALDVVQRAFGCNLDTAFDWLHGRLGLGDDDVVLLKTPSRSIKQREDGTLHDAETGEVLSGVCQPYVEEQRAPFVIERHGEPSPFPPTGWLVKNLIPDSGVMLLAGMSGAAKTFMAVHMATAMATKTQFLALPTRKRCGSVFLLGEGRGTIRRRLDAAAGAVEDAEVPLDRLPISFFECAVATPQERAAVVKALQSEADRMQREHRVGLGVVFVDTLAACCRFEDENSSAETTKAMVALADIASQLGVLVVAIAHHGKSAESGVRGSSALTASADVILTLTAEKEDDRVVHRQVGLAKTRDGETGAKFAFDLRSVHVADDEDGEPILSAYVARSDQPTIHERPTRPRPLSPAAAVYKRAFDVVFDRAVEIMPFGSEGGRWKAVTTEHVRSEFFASYPAEGDTHERRTDAKRKAFKNGQKSLLSRNMIATREIDGVEYVWQISTDVPT